MALESDCQVWPGELVREKMSPSTDRSENREFATELKFLLERGRAEEIQDWVSTRLEADPYADADGRYLVTSLYFDTEARDVYARHGSYGRSKYRVRRYGEDGVIFAERKMKRKDRVGKTRTTVNEDELALLAEAEPVPYWPGYWFHRRLVARRLAAVCQISYRRMARAMMTPQGPMRLTLDSDVRAVPIERAEFQRAGGVEVLDRRILEIKFRREMPAMFQELCRRFLLTPQPVSKYRMAAAELGLVANRSVCLVS
jgi:VTC domain